ncbi:MAG: sce7726 family protein [Bacteroidota bacterium]|nr:MAG: sce7726 family protein [Bacteroidota bacterium]
MQKQYRCEYVYKNNIFLDIIKEHGLKDTLTLNEFRVGASKADLVMLNGMVRIFEIKTELDDFSKLSKQLNDYQKFADGVSIVTDERNAEKLKLSMQIPTLVLSYLTQRINCKQLRKQVVIHRYSILIQSSKF